MITYIELRMLTPLLLLVCTVALASGCKTIHPQTAATPQGRALINERAEGEDATLIFRHGGKVQARSLRVMRDSLTWLDSETSSVRDAALCEVAAISFYTTRHVWRNAELGLLIGAFGGYIAGYTSVFSTRHEAGVFGAIAFGIIGAAIGVMVGIDHTNKDVYLVKNCRDLE